MADVAGLEDDVVQLLRDTLQVEVVERDANLFETGTLDSLALISLIAEIELRFGFEIPLDDFDLDSFTSVERIAVFVAENGTNGAGPDGAS
ncbi:MAG: acyl carrier protein [Acidimicrobiales bacterium]